MPPRPPPLPPDWVWPLSRCLDLCGHHTAQLSVQSKSRAAEVNMNLPLFSSKFSHTTHVAIQVHQMTDPLRQGGNTIRLPLRQSCGRKDPAAANPWCRQEVPFSLCTGQTGHSGLEGNQEIGQAVHRLPAICQYDASRRFRGDRMAQHGFSERAESASDSRG